MSLPRPEVGSLSDQAAMHSPVTETAGMDRLTVGWPSLGVTGSGAMLFKVVRFEFEREQHWGGMRDGCDAATVQPMGVPSEAPRSSPFWQ